MKKTQSSKGSILSKYRLFMVIFFLSILFCHKDLYAAQKLNASLSISKQTCTVKADAGYDTYSYAVTVDGKTTSKDASNTYTMDVTYDKKYSIVVTAKKTMVKSTDSADGDQTQTTETEVITAISDPLTVCLPGYVKNLKTCGINKTKMTLSWDAKTTAASYIVYRGSTKVGTTKKNSMDISLSYGKSYSLKVVPVSASGNGPATSITYQNKSFVATNHKKYSYSEMVSDINSLKKKYNGLVTVKSIATTADNRKVYDVIVGNPKAKKCIMVTASMHAREYMTSIVVMKQMEYYLENQTSKIGKTTVGKTLNKVCIHFVPMVNPDGVMISQNGASAISNSSLRSKVRKMGASSRWKANARGVDLNRNWKYRWRKSGHAGSQGYTGSSAFSEKETKALASLKKSLKKSSGLKGIISYHTMGNMIFGSTSGTTSSVKSGIKKMYNLAKSLTGYRNADSIYASSGATNSREWDMYILKVPSITIECGSHSAPGPISEFSGIWKKNKNVTIREAQIFY